MTDNLTQAERSALRDIQERDDIIIKPSDKGSAGVVMDKTTYIYKKQKDNCPIVDSTKNLILTLH